MLEIYRYTNSIVSGLPTNNRNGAKGTGKELSEEEKQNNKNRGVFRSKQKFIRLINSNKDLCRFLTLTFAADVRDLDLAFKLYNAFIKRVQTRYPHFKAIGVTEFQDKTRNGVVHFHLLVNIWLPHKEWKELWQTKTYRKKKINIEEAGNVDIRWAKDKKDVDNVGLYMINGYMKKAFEDERLEGRRKYKRHGFILEPEVEAFVDEDALQSFLDNNNIKLTDNKLMKSSTFEMKGRDGEVEYKSYNFNELFDATRLKLGDGKREKNTNKRKGKK